MRQGEHEFFQRIESERGYLRAALRVTPTDQGGRETPLASGYRANWRFDDDDGVEVQYGAPITIEGGEWLAPGEEGVVRLHPMFPDYWKGLAPGARLTMCEGRRAVGTATVLEVVPPSRRSS